MPTASATNMATRDQGRPRSRPRFRRLVLGTGALYDSGKVRRRSRSTASTSALSPSSSAATAACVPVQKRHSFPREVNAAISSRNPGESGEGPRITSCVNRIR